MLGQPYPNWSLYQLTPHRVHMNGVVLLFLIDFLKAEQYTSYQQRYMYTTIVGNILQCTTGVGSEVVSIHNAPDHTMPPPREAH